MSRFGYEQQFSRSTPRACFGVVREVLAGYNDLATTDSQLLSEWDYEKNKWKPTEVSSM